ncbi:cell division protein PerM [Modestobacter lapidis]|nr:hypothetical protein [Modestobacter lapidis]
MTSLLPRLPRTAQRRPGEPWGPGTGWVAAATGLAVTGTGLLALLLALVVVQQLDPAGGLPLSSSGQVAGQLWLLAHGAELHVASGPLRIAPLLLTLGVAWGLSRAGRSVVALRELHEPGAVAGAVAVLVGVHTALTVAVAALVTAAGASIGLLRPAAGAAVLALVAGGLGVLRESELGAAVLDRFPGPATAVCRAALAGAWWLAAGCTAVVAVALAVDIEGVAALTTGLGGAGAGAAGQVGLSLLLLPNATAAVIGLAAGPGFLVGAGTVISVGGVTLGGVPALPLVAALPDTQAVPLLAFVSQALPVLAGLGVGTALGRRMGDADGGTVTAALWGIVAGIGVGLLAGVFVLLGGGQLGDAGLAEVGAPALATGLSVAAQAGLAAAPAAAVSRWRSRG